MKSIVNTIFCRYYELKLWDDIIKRFAGIINECCLINNESIGYRHLEGGKVL